MDDIRNIVKKTILYEKGLSNDKDLSMKGVHLAYFQDTDNDGKEDRHFIHTSEFLRDKVQQYNCEIERIYKSTSTTKPSEMNDLEGSVEQPHKIGVRHIVNGSNEHGNNGRNCQPGNKARDRRGGEPLEFRFGAFKLGHRGVTFSHFCVSFTILVSIPPFSPKCKPKPPVFRFPFSRNVLYFSGITNISR